MTQPNSPATGTENSPEVIVNRGSKGLALSLIKSAMEKELGNPINPRKFNSYRAKKDVIHEAIRTEVAILRIDETDTYGDVSDEDIEKYTNDKELALLIANHAKKLIMLRKRAEIVAGDFIPKDIKDANPLWENAVNQRLGELKEGELEFIVLQKAKMRRLLSDIFPEMANIPLEERRVFSKIFHDYESLPGTTEDDKNRIRRIISSKEQFGQNPGLDDVEFILELYATAPNPRKKELLVTLSVFISIRLAVEYGLVEKDFVKKFAEREYSDIYNAIDDDKKDLFCKSLERLQLQVLKPSELDEDKIGTIFRNPLARDELAEEVFRSINIGETLEKRTTNEPDIMLDIAEEKRAEREKALEEGRDIEEENYNMLDAFIERITKMKKGNGEPLLGDAYLLKNGDSILEIDDTTFGKQYIQILLNPNSPTEAIDVRGNAVGYGIRMVGLPVENGEIRREQDMGVKTFQQFLTILRNTDEATMISRAQFESDITTRNFTEREKGKIYDARELEEEEINMGNIADKVNLLDPEGSKFGFREGTAFIAPSREVGSEYDTDDIWEIVSLSENEIVLRDSWGIASRIDFRLGGFYAFLKGIPSFQRVGKIEGDTEFLAQLKERKVGNGAKLKDGKISITEDHHGHEKERTVECFKSENGGHIRIESIQNGIIRFGEFNESGEDIEKVKKYAENKGIDDTVKSYYLWQTMSYTAFLNYLEKGKFEATSDQLIKEPSLHDLGHHGHEEHYHAHMEGSLLKRIMKWQNPASIIKGFEMLYHGIEHTLEKGAKLDAARFAMNTSKLLHLPDGVSAQIYSDITSASKEILEKYEQKIFGLPGPRGREKCIHIVHNKDSRPEEVMSAINYMLKSYGHLYAEDIKHYQSKVSPDSIKNAPAGYFAFFDAFVLTGKLGGDLVGWRQEAYDRAITEMGEKNDHEGEPTEEQMIHALLKTIDGNWDKYLYAASVMKANGGPSGFEKIWKFEGYENAYKKGKDQSQMVNAQGRLNKSISFLGTHEIYKAIGAMEAMAAKTKLPGYQALPFVWAVGGYSGHASHAALQKLKAYAENGLSFHAFGFLRNKESNMLYRNTVRIALEDLIKDGRIPADALKEFDSICERLDHGPEDAKVTKKEYGKVHPPMAMMKFWQKYQARGLHDMLQGQNGWLISKSEEDPTVNKYMGNIRDPQAAHGMLLKDPKIPSVDYGQDWFNEHGYMNMILAKDDGRLNENHKGLMSLHSMLNKIVFKGTAASGGRPMNDEHYEKIWFYIKRYMTDVNGLRDKRSFKGNPDLQKRQYLAHREQILSYLRQELNTMIDRAGESAEGRKKTIAKVIATYPYYSDLADMGISPESVFDKELADNNAEQDYNYWTKGLRSEGSIRSAHGSIDLAEMVSKKAHRATVAPGSRKARTAGPGPIDMDTLFGGGAADTSEDGTGA